MARQWWAPWRAVSLRSVAVVVAVALLALLLRELRGDTARAQTTAIKINFQPASAPAYAGYLIDGGAIYGARGNGQTYGWNVDNTANARDRNAANSPDQRYDTLNHMQKTAGVSWDIAVPNGTYSVRIVAGDPSNVDSVYRINAEGLLVVSGTPSSTTKWFEGTQTVTVADGKLTITNGAGASNNKINFIDITSVPPVSSNTPTSTRLTCGSVVTATSTPTASPTVNRTPTTTATRTNTACGFIVVTNTAVPTVGGNLPDLVITSMYVEMDGRTPGFCVNQYTPYGVRVHVANNGTAAAGSFIVSLGSLQQTVGGLAVGQTVVVTFPNTSSGTAVVDSANQVVESNESNNSRTQIAITGTPPARCTPTPVPPSTSTAVASPTRSPTRTPTTIWGLIQGTVRKGSSTGPGVSGVTVLLSVNGAAASTHLTDANGFYSISMPTKNPAPVPVRLWTSPVGSPAEYSWSYTWGSETRDFVVP